MRYRWLCSMLLVVSVLRCALTSDAWLPFDATAAVSVMHPLAQVSVGTGKPARPAAERPTWEPDPESTLVPATTAAGVIHVRKTQLLVWEAEKGAYANTMSMRCRSSLEWMRQHLHSKDRWSRFAQGSGCTDMGCGSGTWAGLDSQLAISALCTLSFIGCGYDHKSANAYKSTVKRSLEFFVSSQRADGSWSNDTSVHAMVAMALSEAYGMTSDADLAAPCERALQVILDRQVRVGEQRWGWAGSASAGTICETVATTWNVMALKSAKMAGLKDAEAGLAGAKHWLEQTWAAANPKLNASSASTARGVFPDRFDPVSRRCWLPEQHEMALTCAVLTGSEPGDILCDSLANRVIEDWTSAKPPTDMQRAHFATLGLFYAQGAAWPWMNREGRAQLLRSQNDEDTCAFGSFSPLGGGPVVERGGRAMATALATLRMQVFFRWDLLHKNRTPTAP